MVRRGRRGLDESPKTVERKEPVDPLIIEEGRRDTAETQLVSHRCVCADHPIPSTVFDTLFNPFSVHPQSLHDRPELFFSSHRSLIHGVPMKFPKSSLFMEGFSDQSGFSSDGMMPRWAVPVDEADVR